MQPQRGEIRINKEGEWFFNGAPIINTAILELFNASIQTGEGGGYCLQIGQETSPITVEDTPYVVTRVERELTAQGESLFQIYLSDGTRERLSCESLYIAADNVPYCRVKGGRFPARFKRAPYYALADFIRQEGERFFLENEGIRHYLEIR